MPVGVDAAPSVIQNHIDRGTQALSAGDGDDGGRASSRRPSNRVSLADLELATALVNRGLAYQTGARDQTAVDDYSAACGW